jgi:hypothetical protein
MNHYLLNIKIVFKTFFLLALVSFGLIKGSYAQPNALPSKAWVSLDYTGLGALPQRHLTINPSPPDWKWVHKQCDQGTVIRGFQPVLNKVGAFIVPVFDNGECFYDTAVEPFKDRNPNAKADEKALQSLLAEAQKSRVPIYLGLDLLAWHKSRFGQILKNELGIFAKLPDWQELYSPTLERTPEALYASPFNPKVRTALISLVTEIAAKFPQASGIVINCHLSNRGLLGFSEAARVASVVELGIDPIDLDITARVIDRPGNLNRWLEWRREQMASLLKAARDAYQQGHKTGQVIFNGTTGYYEVQALNDVRMTQDWRFWLNTGVADTVFIEGRWLPAYQDDRYLNDFINEAAELGRTSQRKITLRPVLSGPHIVPEGDYGREWISLKKRIPGLDEAAFLARTDNDLQKIVALVSGHIETAQISIPKVEVDAVLPSFTLADSQGKLWDSAEFSQSQPALLLIANGKAPTLPTILKTLRTAGTTQGQRWKPFIISSFPLKKESLNDGLNVSDSGVTNLIDGWREVLSSFRPGLTAVALDSKGFVRLAESITSPAQLPKLVAQAKKSLPILEIGQPAPKFSLTDMKGRRWKLSELSGKKNLLLTFFPKCSSGG